MKSLKTTGKSGLKKVEPLKPVEEILFDNRKGALDAALYYAKDILERSQIPFFCLGEMVRQMIEDNRIQHLPVITLGVYEKDFSPKKDTLIECLKGNSLSRGPRKDWEISEDFIKFDYVPEPMIDHPVVPIVVQRIKKSYKYFDYPDTVFYDYSEYRIPNSFSYYWSERHLIK